MPSISRRDFLASSGSCAAHLALAATFMPSAARVLWARAIGTVVAREPFGTLEKVADGVWALISNPFGGDSTTISNGGIIAGRDGVLAIEGFYTPKGAEWLGGKARELTGHWPTHVAVTHYHADHANGVAGYLAGDGQPVVRSTEKTRDLVIARNKPADASRTATLEHAVLLSPTESTVLDLGGRVVRVIPRSGHTESDVSLEMDEPSIVFCGDLVWNGIFPNYVDAVPTELSKSARALRRSRDTVYVPGHGALTRQAELDRYYAIIDEVERAARSAHAKGQSPADAAAAFAFPPALAEGLNVNKPFVQRAFEAWERDLSR
jgi:glyoxylase-like metal-dependent hydrolase (beta-lactamase superfamily II)